MAVGRRRQSSLYRVSAAVVEPPALLLTTVLLIASTPYISSQGIAAHDLLWPPIFNRTAWTAIPAHKIARAKHDVVVNNIPNFQGEPRQWGH